jgi:hypothetical protein
MTFLCFRDCKNPGKCYSPKALRDKTRADTLTRKGIYQCNEGMRYRGALKEGDVFAYCSEERPVPDMARCKEVYSWNSMANYSRRYRTVPLLRPYFRS